MDDRADKSVGRFAELVRLPDGQIPLDEAACLVAGHNRPSLDVAAVVGQLDALAAACPTPTFRGWHQYMFAELGFRGDPDHYHEPESSWLDVVIERRRGIPIALSVVCIEVGRRLGLRVEGVGMPGHFLVRHHDSVPPTWIDPYLGGRLLGRAECAERFAAVNGDSTPFRDSYLEPVGARSILTRMLANLRLTYTRRGDLVALESVLRMSMVIPGAPVTERRDHARLLAARGRFLEAARELESLAEAEPKRARAFQSEAAAIRARLN